MTRKYPIAYVEWVDSTTMGDGWAEPDAEAIERALVDPCFSAGFLISQTAAGVVLAVGVNAAQEDVVGAMAIPASSIRRLVLLDPDNRIVTGR